MTVSLTNTPVLTTDRLTIRAPEGHDVAGWTAMAATQRTEFIKGPYSPQAAYRAWGFVIGHWCMRGFGSFVLERNSDGRAIGHAGPWYPEGWPERELGWVIWDAEAEGQGYAFEAMSAIRDHVFSDLGWDTAVSYIDEGNTRAQSLAERLGAVRDDAATKPDNDLPPVMVYRHPTPALGAAS